MKNSFFLKNYGLLFGTTLPFLSIILCYTTWTGIVYNGWRLEWNAVCLVAMAGLSFLLIKQLRHTRPWMLLAFYILSVFGVINFIISLLIDWINRSPDLDNDAKGLSWLIIMPAMWVVLIIWGWQFDRIKNRQPPADRPVTE